MPQGQPVFREKDEMTYIFDFSTSLACQPEPVDCHAIDNQGNEYDLSGLAKSDGNYMVPDPERSTLKYYINLCQPLNPQAETNKCPGTIHNVTARNNDYIALLTVSHEVGLLGDFTRTKLK